MPDLENERWKRDAGMRRAAEAASPGFARDMWVGLRSLASTSAEFNSDELHQWFEDHELAVERPLAFGQLFARAARNGFIYKTDNRRQTRTKGGHLRDYPLYRGRGW